MGQSGHSARAAEIAAGGTSLVFRAGSLLCALRLDDVIETMRPLPVRALAGTPAFVRGICVMRGVPTPVVDVARLLGGEQVEFSRFVAVRTERGPVAFATGPVLGIRTVATGDATTGHAALLAGTGAASPLVAGIATIGAEPLMLLQSMRVVPDEVWVQAAGQAVP
jgi:purine-binding chemotaxis protein CheW